MLDLICLHRVKTSQSVTEMVFLMHSDNFLTFLCFLYLYLVYHFFVVFSLIKGEFSGWYLVINPYCKSFKVTNLSTQGIKIIGWIQVESTAKSGNNFFLVSPLSKGGYLYINPPLSEFKIQIFQSYKYENLEWSKGHCLCHYFVT